MSCKWKVIPLVAFLFLSVLINLLTLFFMFVNCVFSLLVAKTSCCVHMRVTASSTISCTASSKFEILLPGTPFFIWVQFEFLFPCIFGSSHQWVWHKWRTVLFLPTFCFFSRICFVVVGSNPRRTDWIGETILSRSVRSKLPTKAALHINRVKTSALNRSAACLMLLPFRKALPILKGREEKCT